MHYKADCDKKTDAISLLRQILTRLRQVFSGQMQVFRYQAKRTEDIGQSKVDIDTFRSYVVCPLRSSLSSKSYVPLA